MRDRLPPPHIICPGVKESMVREKTPVGQGAAAWLMGSGEEPMLSEKLHSTSVTE